ncbi:MAG: M23 family metallopeptidase [Acidobacteriota bacterium]|nr:M23 family metallopeptidase [Acidobacteriota bacterium]
MQFIRFFFIALCLLAQFACDSSEAQSNRNQSSVANQTPKVIADGFAYPIGKTETVTQMRDKKDEWFNAQDFGENNHLGEDWNKNSGGNTDCGEPVFAAGGGVIVFAENAGAGWGNVVIIEHNLPDGKKIQTLYGHLQTISKRSGEVKKREQIGTIGNADGRYFCHLHFELREESCPEWNKAGGGYSAQRAGWLDPSDFIDGKRN